MSEFFRGWRQKIGVVTLVIALAITSAWVRSYSLIDRYGFHPHPDEVVGIISARGRVICCLIHGMTRGVNGYVVSADAFCGSRPLHELHNFEETLDPEKTRRWYLFGFELAMMSGMGIVGDQTILIIPYWSLVMPLTVLSTYLMLFRVTTNPVCCRPQLSPEVSQQSQ